HIFVSNRRFRWKALRAWCSDRHAQSLETRMTMNLFGSLTLKVMITLLPLGTPVDERGQGMQRDLSGLSVRGEDRCRRGQGVTPPIACEIQSFLCEVRAPSVKPSAWKAMVGHTQRQLNFVVAGILGGHPLTFRSPFPFLTFR